MTLLAAMWLQFALAVSENKRFVECKFCNRLFEISRDQTGFRTHRKFCSGACRTKDYRRRKRAARKLAAEGSPLSTIAEQVQADRATVRGWLDAASATAKPKK